MENQLLGGRYVSVTVRQCNQVMFLLYCRINGINELWALRFGAVWREFLWGAIAGAFGEGMMHPIDTIKTRIQSQAILSGSQV